MRSRTDSPAAASRPGRAGATAAGESRLFYGWRIVGLTMVTQLVAVGGTSYIFGIYVEPIAADFGASRLVITSGMAILLLAMALVAPLLGHWLDKHSIRNTMCVGALMMGAGFACLSRAGAVWQLGLILVVLVGMGAAMLGPLPSSKLVTNWFHARRGRALGISTLGTSLGGFLLPPIVAALILYLGWRGSLVVLALAILLFVLPLVYHAVVDNPRDINLSMDGAAANPPVEQATDARPAGVRVSTILLQPNFWGIGLCVGCLSSAGAILLTHFAAYSREFGLSLTAAAMVISCYSFTSMLGKLGFGYLSDLYDNRLLIRLAIAWNSLCWIVFLAPHSLAALMAGSALLGLGAGATMPLWNALVASCFGRRVFARAMGYMGLLVLPLTLVPMPIGGFVFDRYGSYLLVFQLALVLFFLAFLASFLIRVPQHEPGS